MEDLNARTWLVRRSLKRTNFWEVNFGCIFDGFCLRSRIIWLRSACVLIKVATLRQRKKRQIILMSCGTVSTRLKQSRACNLFRKKILSGGIIKKYVCDCLTFSYEPANHSGRKHSHILWLSEDIQSFFRNYLLMNISRGRDERKSETFKASTAFDGLSCGLIFWGQEIIRNNYKKLQYMSRRNNCTRAGRTNIIIRSHLKSWRWYGEERHRWSIMWRGNCREWNRGQSGRRVIHGKWNEFLLDLDCRNLHAAAISGHVKTRFIAPFRALLTWDIQNRLKVRTLERVQMSDSSEL